VTELDQGEAKENVSEVRSGTKPIFAIFEGGGAKGIVHVGAYAAADELQFEFVGVAGASAGSIIASLIAVGFKPKNIFNPEVQGENIFSAHNLSPTEALGAQGWRQFQRLRRVRFKSATERLMNKVFHSYRELLADALSPKQPKRNADIVVVTDIQFQPSEASLRRADEVRRRVRADMAELSAAKA
jgi:predicted acylesterase/phospholipase RssA